MLLIANWEHRVDTASGYGDNQPRTTQKKCFEVSLLKGSQAFNTRINECIKKGLAVNIYNDKTSHKADYVHANNKNIDFLKM